MLIPNVQIKKGQFSYIKYFKCILQAIFFSNTLQNHFRWKIDNKISRKSFQTIAWVITVNL